MGSGEHLQVTVESAQHVKSFLFVSSLDAAETKRWLGIPPPPPQKTKRIFYILFGPAQGLTESAGKKSLQ